MGKKSYIQHPIILQNKKNISVGERVFIRDFARIETVEKWDGIDYNPKIIIGNNVNIEQGVHLTCANKVQIGDGCVLSSYVMLTDIDHDYTDINKRILAQKLIVKETVVGENSFIGTGVKIMAGVHLGKHCIVGANSVVTQSFPDYCVIVGIPGKCIKRFNVESMDWEKTDSSGNFI